jgi:predicted Abi (CAAX) family protease
VEIVALRMLLDYGTTPALILLIVVILWFRKDLVKRIDDFEEEMKSIRNDIEYIKREYVKKEDYYQDLSGWRSELGRVIERIDKMMEMIVRVMKQ